MIRTSVVFLLVCCLNLAAAAATRHVSPAGIDQGQGPDGSPWQTLSYALAHVNDGDTILLHQGDYAGGVVVRNRNLVIRSFPGETAAVSVSATGAAQNCIEFDLDASGCALRGLDISGGYYYAVKTNGNWASADPVWYGAGDIVIDSCRIHGSGRDCVKITPGCDRITIRDCEIYDSGVRDGSNAEGIDNVNGDSMLVQDCRIHHTATNGIYPKGGAIGCVIERCLFENTAESAICLGQSTGWTWFDSVANPSRYECIDCIARNNVITSTAGAGIQLQAALRPRVYNNTLVGVAQSSRGGLQILGTTQTPPTGPAVFVPTTDPVFVNNIVVMAAGSRPGVFIVADGVSGTITIDHNCYYRSGGSVAFWDEREGLYGLTFQQWQTRMGETGSMSADPLVDGACHIGAASPCRDVGANVAGVTVDWDGDTRPQGSAFDIGADEYVTATVLMPQTGSAGAGSVSGGCRLAFGAQGHRARALNGPVWDLSGRVRSCAAAGCAPHLVVPPVCR